MNANLPLEELFQKVYRIFAVSFGKAALLTPVIKKKQKKVRKENLKESLTDQSIA